MVRNLAFILYVLSHVSAFFFIMVNFLKKKKKKKKTGKEMFTAALHVVGKRNAASLGGPQVSSFLNWSYCDDVAIVSIPGVQAPLKNF